MQQPRRRPGYTYWFPARKFGWGWGIPKTWQGWIVIDIYTGFFILFLFIALFGGGGNTYLGFGGLIVITIAMLWVCIKKGEPPRWRWGR